MPSSPEHRIVRRARRAKAICTFGLVVLVVATGFTEFAAGKAIDGTDSGLAQAETALGEAAELARSTSQVASRIGDLTTSVGAAITNTDQALAATGDLATTVRKLVEVATPVVKSLGTINASLAESEKTFSDLRANVAATKATVDAVAPELKKAVDRLANVPPQLDSARLRVASSRHHLSNVLLFLRVGIALLAVVIGAVLLGVRETAAILSLRARDIA